ncbi:MAG TPA: FAD-dependent oxidoreductase, partial [Actinomycetota bacterium]|nr:FAD-dependent oxidoreductase [Actinomycetota bacterium]
MESTPDRSFQPLTTDLRIECCVIGGGIAGLTTALLLQRAGMKVAVLEMDGIARGVSGYTTAKVSSLQGEVYQQLESKHGREAAALYAASNEAALAQVRSFVSDLSIDCDLETRSNYTYCEDPSDLSKVEQEAEAASRAGLPVEFVHDTDLPFEVAGAVRLDDQAQFHPRKYLLGLVDELERGGCLFFDETRATGLDDGDPCVVETSG